MLPFGSSEAKKLLRLDGYLAADEDGQDQNVKVGARPREVGSLSG